VFRLKLAIWTTNFGRSVTGKSDKIAHLLENPLHQGNGGTADRLGVDFEFYMASKVHPSPGAARSVWALPLTASSSCNMVVAEEDGHAHADDIHLDHRPHSPPLAGRGTDGGHGEGGVEDHENVLLFEGLDGATTVNLDDIFDIIKNGEVSEVENLVDKFGMANS